MKLISVGVNKGVDEIKAKLHKDCLILSQQGFRIVIDEIQKGSYTFLGCNIIEGELSFRSYELIKGLLKSYVAKILADYIIFEEESDMIRKILNSHYSYLSEDEQIVIYNSIVKNLRDCQGEFLPRYTGVLDKLMEYLENNHELVVEGFINFRLKEYREGLIQMVDIAADDFMSELEYKEFVKILRYFVDIQKPKIEEVHVILNADASFTILDALGKTINHSYIDNFAASGSDEMNHEDLLVTALISIAPYNIMLHNACGVRNENITETIKSVFDSRVFVCSGCEVCDTAYLGISSPK